jgi:hypothetical protein
MRRRAFIAGLWNAVALPLASHAQQPERMRRIGVLMVSYENSPFWKTPISAFTEALAGLGWADGRNVRIHFRGYGDDANPARSLAHELVALQNFGLQGCARAEQPGHGVPDQLEEIAHRRDYRPSDRQLFCVYGRYRG